MIKNSLELDLAFELAKSEDSNAIWSEWHPDSQERFLQTARFLLQSPKLTITKRRTYDESLAHMKSIQHARDAKKIPSSFDNPILRDVRSYVYVAERLTMNNPKGWAHVLRRVSNGMSRGLYLYETPQHRESALVILERLARLEEAFEKPSVLGGKLPRHMESGGIL